jgi:hypothetical protein
MALRILHAVTMEQLLEIGVLSALALYAPQWLRLSVAMMSRASAS